MSRFTFHASRLTPHRLLIVACLLLSACTLPGSVKPTVKIGLSAPFEGQHRDLGYEALYAVRLAVQQRNEAQGVGERYLIELVALNDFNEPQEAILQARKMAVDPKIMGVLGGWSPETAHVAAPEYERLGLAFLTPEADWTGAGYARQEPVRPEFAADYQTVSGGLPPGPIATWAYAEANRLLDTLDASTRAAGKPTRQKVSALLAAGN